MLGKRGLCKGRINTPQLYVGEYESEEQVMLVDIEGNGHISE